MTVAKYKTAELLISTMDDNRSVNEYVSELQTIRDELISDPFNIRDMSINLVITRLKHITMTLGLENDDLKKEIKTVSELRTVVTSVLNKLITSYQVTEDLLATYKEDRAIYTFNSFFNSKTPGKKKTLGRLKTIEKLIERAHGELHAHYKAVVVSGSVLARIVIKGDVKKIQTASTRVLDYDELIFREFATWVKERKGTKNPELIKLETVERLLIEVKNLELAQKYTASLITNLQL